MFYVKIVCMLPFRSKGSSNVGALSVRIRAHGSIAQPTKLPPIHLPTHSLRTSPNHFPTNSPPSPSYPLLTHSLNTTRPPTTVSSFSSSVLRSFAGEPRYQPSATRSRLRWPLNSGQESAPSTQQLWVTSLRHSCL